MNADNIVVGNGSKQALYNACLCLFGPREKVLIPTPAWTSYPQIVHLSRATPVELPGDPEWSLKTSVKDLDRHYDESVKGLIMNSPANPTGAVYTLAELKAIAEWARRKGVWVIADEIYRRIHYGAGPAPSFLDLPDDLLERVVIIDGASKAYAMTGWRIGFALGPRELARTMNALQSHTTSGANTIAMWAARLSTPRRRASRSSSPSRSNAIPPWAFVARTVVTSTAAFGAKPPTRHTMSQNFWSPRSLPKPASVTV